MNPKRIYLAVVVAVVALAAFGCAAAEETPVAEAPATDSPAVTTDTPAEELAVAATEEASEPTVVSEEVELAQAGETESLEPDKPAEPKMVRKPIAWPVFKFDPGVPEEDREFIRRVVKTVRSYFVIARLNEAAVKVVVKGYWNDCPFNFLAMGDNQGLKVCLKSPGWQDKDAVLNWRTLSHEWFHVVQQNLADRGYLSAGGLNEIPAWFSEGSAEWMAWNAVVHFNVESQSYAESTIRWWASNVTVPLKRMLTVQQIVDASPGSADSYEVAYWAVDYLGATPQKLLLFYRRLGEGMDFQKAAKKTFGRAIDSKFYRDFEEFRSRGFYG